MAEQITVLDYIEAEKPGSLDRNGGPTEAFNALVHNLGHIRPLKGILDQHPTVLEMEQVNGHWQVGLVLKTRPEWKEWFAKLQRLQEAQEMTDDLVAMVGKDRMERIAESLKGVVTEEQIDSALKEHFGTMP